MCRVSLTLSMFSIALFVMRATEAAAPSGAKVEYSADSYVETAELKMKSKVHYAPGKERREMDTGGGRHITIMRWDRKVSWVVMPSENMYIENPLKESDTDASGYKVENSQIMGEETVDGVKTTKSKVILSDDKGNKFGGFMWTTKEGIQLKMDAISVDASQGTKMRMKMELKNVQIGKQDPKLFEIPAGYTKMNMGGFGPGGINPRDMMRDRR
jgi:hypothetical protein